MSESINKCIKCGGLVRTGQRVDYWTGRMLYVVSCDECENSAAGPWHYPPDEPAAEGVYLVKIRSRWDYASVHYAERQYVGNHKWHLCNDYREEDDIVVAWAEIREPEIPA